jgi:hypothetical protein
VHRANLPDFSHFLATVSVPSKHSWETLQALASFL